MPLFRDDFRRQVLAAVEGRCRATPEIRAAVDHLLALVELAAEAQGEPDLSGLASRYLAHVREGRREAGRAICRDVAAGPAWQGAEFLRQVVTQAHALPGDVATDLRVIVNRLKEDA